MKKILILAEKGRLEVNETKFKNEGFNLVREYDLGNTSIVKKKLFTFIILDGINNQVIESILKINPLQNLILVIENESDLRGVIETRFNVKYIKKPCTTDDLVFVIKNSARIIDIYIKTQIDSHFCNLFSRNEIYSNSSEFIEESLRFVANFIHADSGSIMLLNQDKTKLVIEALIGNNNFLSTEIDKEEGLSGWILSKNKSIIIDRNKISSEKIEQYLSRNEINSSINLIIEGHKGLLGIINLNSLSNRFFTEIDMNIVVYYVSKLANFLEYVNTIKNRENLILTLKEKNSDMESFVYSAFHDLKTPLFTLQGFLNTFKENYYSKLDEQGIRYLMLISSGASRLGKMLNDVFEFFRFDKIDYQFEKVDMTDVVNMTIDQLQILLDDDDVIINKSSFEKNKIFVNGNAIYLTTIWANLLTNAVKYRKDDEDLIINLGFVDDGGDMYVCFVEDNGIGIDMNNSDFIFRLFNRIKDKDVEGTGVGLKKKKKIVSKHGGNVWLESEKGKGSKFYFSIPKFEK
jgi:signal transduction histidine kinase